MSDKLNILTSNIIRFVAGERPTADKFNAMNQYFSRSIENICRAIGDMYGRSISDPLSPKWNPHSSENGRSLDIATIGRLIGPASNLNPKMFRNTSYIEEEFSYEELYSNGFLQKEIQLKYRVNTILIPVVKIIDGEGLETQLSKTNTFNDIASNRYTFYNEKNIGLHPNLTIEEGSVLYVSYETDASEVEGGANYLNAGWNVIPDPNQNSKIRFLDGSLPQALNGDGVIALAEVSSGYDYVINLTDYKIESQQSGAVNLRDSEIQSLNNEYNQDKDFELPSWYEDKFRTDDNATQIIPLPEGLIYLKDLTSKEIYLTASYGYLSSKELYIKDANLCEDHEFCLILTGTDITTSIDDLRNKMFNHRHDGSFGEPFIRIQDLVGKFVTGEFGPSSIPGNEFPMYLHRKGYRTDTNVLNGNNAMLGDLFMGSTAFNGISNASIETENTTHKILFGNELAKIYKTATGLRDPVTGELTGYTNRRLVIEHGNGLDGNIDINCSNELEISTKYTDVNTQEDVTFDQKNITINTEASNRQVQEYFYSESTNHEDRYADLKLKYGQKEQTNYLAKTAISGLYLLNREKIKNKDLNLDNKVVRESDRNLNRGFYLNPEENENYNYFVKEETKTIKSKKYRYILDFKPSIKQHDYIYPHPTHQKIATPLIQDDIISYGTVYADLDIKELTAFGTYNPIVLDSSVDTMKGTGDGRRKIIHYLPAVEDSFKLNLNKYWVYDEGQDQEDVVVNEDGEITYLVQPRELGVWGNSNDMSSGGGFDYPDELDSETDINKRLGFWSRNNKDINKKVVHFNSNTYHGVHYIFYDATNDSGINDVEKYFQDNENAKALPLYFPNEFTTERDDDDYPEHGYLRESDWAPNGDTFKARHNVIDLSSLILGGFKTNNVSLNNQYLSCNINIGYLPFYWDDDWLQGSAKEDIEARFHLRWVKRNYGIKVVYTDVNNRLGGGNNKEYHSWLKGTANESISDFDLADAGTADYSFKISSYDARPSEDGSDDEEPRLWIVLELKSVINRLFLSAEDVNLDDVDSCILWNDLIEGRTKIILSWLPSHESDTGMPIDFINFAWEDLYDESVQSNTIAFSSDGYSKRGYTAKRQLNTVAREYNVPTEYDVGNLESGTETYDLVKNYSSDEMGVNVHYIMLPRVMDNLEIDEERSFCINTIPTRNTESTNTNSLNANDFYFGKFATGYIEAAGNVMNYAEWIEFPNLILSYGDKESIINYNDLNEDWYDLHFLAKFRSSANVPEDDYTKIVKINGENAYSGKCTHLDLSGLLKKYLMREIVNKYWAFRLVDTTDYGIFDIWSRTSFVDYIGNTKSKSSTSTYEEYEGITGGGNTKADGGPGALSSFLSRSNMTDMGTVFFQPQQKYIYSGNSDFMHKCIGFNFHLEINERKITEYTIVIDINLTTYSKYL